MHLRWEESSMKRRHFLAEWLSGGAGVLVTATIGRSTSKASGRLSTGTSPRSALPPRQSRPRVVLKNEQANGMNVHHVCKWCMVAALVAVGTNLGLHKAIGAQPGPADPEEGVQVLTRGPVHEAFAETVAFDPEPGIVVRKAPPNAIEEIPPDQRPEGVNVAWIPGYTAWDDERNDYLWVSGVWRSPPPGRQWMSGYWGRTQQGFQWTSGYWGDAQVNEIEYLPEPPETVEVGPSIPAPSSEHNWIPGSWVWQQGR